VPQVVRADSIALRTVPCLRGINEKSACEDILTNKLVSSGYDAGHPG